MSFGYSCCALGACAFCCLWHGVRKVLLLYVLRGPQPINDCYLLVIRWVASLNPSVNFLCAIIILSSGWVKSSSLYVDIWREDFPRAGLRGIMPVIPRSAKDLARLPQRSFAERGMTGMISKCLPSMDK